MTQFNTSWQGNKFLLYLRSLLFFVSTTITMLMIGPIVLLLVFFPFEYRYRLAMFWVDLVQWGAKYFCGIDYRVQGLEHIPTDGNVIYLSKHQSAWETLALFKILPGRLVFVLKRELLWIPVWGWAMSTLKHIAINRQLKKVALQALISQGTARLREGFSVVIFPEGTRIAPGEQRKFNAGGALLAQRSGYPVIPIAHNAGTFWPRNSFLKYPGTITVRIGPLIQTKGRQAQEINQEVAAWINATMREIEGRR